MWKKFSNWPTTVYHQSRCTDHCSIIHHRKCMMSASHFRAPPVSHTSERAFLQNEAIIVKLHDFVICFPLRVATQRVSCYKNLSFFLWLGRFFVLLVQILVTVPGLARSVLAFFGGAYPAVGTVSYGSCLLSRRSILEKFVAYRYARPGAQLASIFTEGSTWLTIWHRCFTWSGQVWGLFFVVAAIRLRVVIKDRTFELSRTIPSVNMIDEWN